MFVSKINRERSEPEKIAFGAFKKIRSAVVSVCAFEPLVRVIKHFIYTNKFVMQN